MDTLEEGEIEDSANSGTEMENPDENVAYNVAAKNASSVGQSSLTERVSATAYRSTNTGGDSSSDSNSDVDEDSPLWKQKKHKYLSKNKDRSMDMRASPTLPEYTTNSRPNSQSSLNQGKKKNNIWGSVLEEQTLTQSMSKSVGVKNKNYIDFDSRTVESYDYRNKSEDSRPDIVETEPPKPDPTDIFEKNDSGSVGRSIVDYEDTVDPKSFSKKRNRGNKRKFEDDSSDRKKGGVFNRLGAKKHQTVTVGEIDVSVEMERDALVKTIADFLHEPKVELIERVIDSMGKEVAIRLVKMTRDVEHAGGMFTFDGSRKRTPGGVFIQLLKQQTEFTKDVKKIVFKEDHERSMEEKKERKRRNKNNRKKNKKSNTSPGDKSRSRSNSNSRSVSPHSNKSKSRDVSDDGQSDDNQELDFEAELARARKRILEEKNKANKDVDMEDCNAENMDKENKNDAEMNDLDGGDVVDVLIDDASID